MTDQPDRPDGDGLRAKLIDFDSFLNEPPPYEDKTMVRDYRHSAYTKWSSLCADIVKLIDAPSRVGAEGAEALIQEARSWKHAHPIGGMQQAWNDGLDERIAALSAPPVPPAAPGHTDLMGNPESIDAFMEKNPLPAPDAMREACSIKERIERLTETLVGTDRPHDPATLHGLRKLLFIVRDLEKRVPGLAPAVAAEPDALADLVSRFSKALLAKLKLAQANGRSGWELDDWEEACQQDLLRHVGKGDPRDVAAYCAFMWHHGWITATPPVRRDRGDHKARANAYSLEKWGVKLEKLPSDMVDGCYDATFEATDASQNRE